MCIMALDVKGVLNGFRFGADGGRPHDLRAAPGGFGDWTDRLEVNSAREAQLAVGVSSRGRDVSE